jgi:hypothetical protein
MNIDRRQALIGSAGAALAGLLGVVPTGPDTQPPGILYSAEWHPLTRSLLERARKIGRHRTAPDKSMVERAIWQFADSSGCGGRPVIKWMNTPADAFDHLSRFGLDALLAVGTSRFWRGFPPQVPPDVKAFEQAFEVRMLANELLSVDEQDRLLMAPKLRAKSEAMSASTSDGDVFRVRAVSSQIGWLETSLADAAAEAVCNVELLLTAGVPAASMVIDHQLRVFESHECGLLATWETSGALVCVPRYDHWEVS